MSLRLQNVTARAGAATLVHGVNLEVKPGRFTAVMGPNGAGKTTALSMLAGDRAPCAGIASLDGRLLAEWSARELACRRAVLSQNSPADFPMTALDVVFLGRMPWPSGHDHDARIVEQALDATGALHLAARDYTTLSGGEKQRVQIARALAQIWECRGAEAPAYLLLDEPTAGLDLKHQILTLEICRAFTRENIGVLCILHDLLLAREFADEVVILRGGEIFANGRPSEVMTPSIIASAFDIDHRRAASLLQSEGPPPLVMPNDAGIARRTIPAAATAVR